MATVCEEERRWDYFRISRREKRQNHCWNKDKMTELREIRECGKRMMITLVALNAIVTIAILVAFSCWQATAGHSQQQSLATFAGIFFVIVVVDGAITIGGFRWFWKRSRCPSCSAFLNQLVVPETGRCVRCGTEWDLRGEHRE